MRHVNIASSKELADCKVTMVLLYFLQDIGLRSSHVPSRIVFYRYMASLSHNMVGG
jgi:hypothetical protein